MRSAEGPTPVAGYTARVSAATSVDFPAPFGPNTATRSPSSMRRLRRSRAVTPSRSTVTWSNSMSGSDMGSDDSLSHVHRDHAGRVAGFVATLSLQPSAAPAHHRTHAGQRSPFGSHGGVLRRADSRRSRPPRSVLARRTVALRRGPARPVAIHRRDPGAVARHHRDFLGDRARRESQLPAGPERNRHALRRRRARRRGGAPRPRPHPLATAHLPAVSRLASGFTGAFVLAEARPPD